MKKGSLNSGRNQQVILCRFDLVHIISTLNIKWIQMIIFECLEKVIESCYDIFGALISSMKIIVWLLEYEIYLSFSLYDTKFAQHVNYFFWSDGICSHLETRKKRTLTKRFSLKWVFSGMKIVLNVTENGTNHKLHEKTGDIKHSMHQKKR